MLKKLTPILSLLILAGIQPKIVQGGFIATLQTEGRKSLQAGSRNCLVSAAVDGCPIVGVDEVGLALRLSCSTGSAKTEEDFLEVTTKVTAELEKFQNRPEFQTFELIMTAIKEEIDKLREKTKNLKIKIAVELDLNGITYADDAAAGETTNELTPLSQDVVVDNDGWTSDEGKVSAS
jgi:hypothetical protein